MDSQEYRALVAAGEIEPAFSKRSKRSSRSTSVSRVSDSKRASKYNAQKTLLRGITFDSKLEANRYIFLKEQERKGVIKDLELQCKLEIKINGEIVCKYIPDFSYILTKSGQFIVEDAKGKLTAIYRLKKKLVKAVLGIEIKEVTKDSITTL